MEEISWNFTDESYGADEYSDPERYGFHELDIDPVADDYSDASDADARLPDFSDQVNQIGLLDIQTSLVHIEQDTSWYVQAACSGQDADTFFAHRSEHEKLESAKEFCMSCTVRLECLDLSLVTKEKLGVWGGVDERERKFLLKALELGLATKESVMALGLHEIEAFIEQQGVAENVSAVDKSDLEIEVWEDQAECLAAIDKAYREGAGRILFQLPPGRGKTTVAALAARRYLQQENPNARIAYICHNEQILRQAHRRFGRILGPSYTYGMFVGKHKTQEEVDVLFTSFQTMNNAREEFGSDRFDLIIIDESHHAAAPTYEPTVDYFTPDLCLAMTATIDRYDLLNIREIFGTEVYSETISEAFAKGRLAMPYYKVMVSVNESKFWKDHKYLGISKYMLNKRLFIPERDKQLIATVQDELAQSGIENPRILGFTNSIEHAERLAALMPRSSAWHTRNAGAINLFKAGKVNTLFTVNMANEGIDIPDINVILFFNRTDSEAKFIQQLGRGARLAEGKTHFLVYDFAGNCDRLFRVEELSRNLQQATGNQIWSQYDRGGMAPPPLRVLGTGQGVFIFTPQVVDIMRRFKEQEAAQDIKGAVGVKAFARDEGVPETTLYKLITRLNLELPIIEVAGRRILGLSPEVQEFLRTQPEFLFRPPLPGEMSLTAFAQTVKCSKPTLLRVLRELGVSVDDLPQRRMNVGRLPVLDEALQLRLKDHFSSPENQPPPPGYLSLNQFRVKTGVDGSTILKFARELGIEPIKRKPDHLVTFVFSPKEQRLIERHPDFFAPPAPHGVVTISAAADILNINKSRIKKAMAVLGIESRPYKFDGMRRGIGLTKAELLRIQDFLDRQRR